VNAGALGGGGGIDEVRPVSSKVKPPDPLMLPERPFKSAAVPMLVPFEAGEDLGKGKGMGLKAGAIFAGSEAI